MPTKKTFDCVDMKRDIQAKLRAKYESSRGSYPSFEAFLEKVATESDLGKRLRTKLARSARRT